MSRVYLLLRNNKQTGPHSLDELISLSPKSFDLIWIEGFSKAWVYPEDIRELKPFLEVKTITPPYIPSGEQTSPYAPKPANENLSKKLIPPKIFVSLPRMADPVTIPVPDTMPFDLEKRASELRRKVEEFTSKNTYPAIKNNLPTENTRSGDFKNDHFNTYTQKVKKPSSFSKKNIWATALLVMTITASFFIIQFKQKGKPGNLSGAVSSPFPVQDTSKNLPGEKIEVRTANINTEEKLNRASVKQDENINTKKNGIDRSSGVDSSVNLFLSEETVVKETESENMNEMADSSVNNEEEIKEEHGVPAIREKKKTIAEKIDNFFNKLGSNKQKDPGVEEESKGSANGPVRKSTRRDDETTTPEERIDLASLVDVTANHPDNWMMGVTGLKLTLRNRSNETIKIATVEVSYYDGHNSLVEKKLVYFTNIGPKKSQTLAAPGQRLADHADFRLLSISNMENGYVKQ